MLDEFSLIESLFAPLARHPGALGLKDDAALLSLPPGQQLVLTTDAAVAGVHFLPDDPADLIARKIVRTNLSDLAAMGAKPIAIMLSAAFPKGIGEDWLRQFANGLARDVEEFSCPLIGGDTVSTPGPLTLSITALGQVAQQRELRRSTARPGDLLFASGTIGDAALGLLVLRGELAQLGASDRDFLVDRYRLPRPRVTLGQQLSGVAHSALDISDGLCADLQHICDCSGVSAVIEVDRLPLSTATRHAIEGSPHLLESVLGGGDDYELLFTAPVACEGDVIAIGERLGVPVTRIGQISEGQGLSVLDSAGREITPSRRGWQHFGNGDS